ncbi:MAG: hypothetical protein OHK0019_38120 [Saprospiraceae bacterium]
MLLLGIPSVMLGQAEKLDSLRKVLANFSQRDTAYVMTLCHIAAAEGFVDPNSAVQHARECMERAEDLNHEAGKIFALNLLALEEQRRGNYPEALKLYLQAVSIAEKGSNKNRLGKTLNNLGLLYFYMEDHDEALRYFFRALPLQQLIRRLQEMGIRKDDFRLRSALGGYLDRDDADLDETVLEFADFVKMLKGGGANLIRNTISGDLRMQAFAPLPENVFFDPIR